MPQCTNKKNDDDDKLPGRNGLHGASTKDNFSVGPISREIQYRLLAPSEESYFKMMAYILRNEEAIITLPLEHDPMIEGLHELYVIPKDIKDMIGRNW